MKYYKKSMLLLIMDMLCLVFACIGAYLFRFDFDLLHKINILHSIHIFGVSAVAYMAMFYLFKMHRIIWRYASIREMVKIAKSVSCGFVLTAIVTYLFFGAHYVPSSILPLQAFFYLSFLVASRALYRFYRLSSDHNIVISKKVLIIGAGQAAEGVLRDMLQHAERGYQPIGILDDDPGLQNRSLRGIKVLGPINQVQEYIKKSHIDMVVFAIPSLNNNKLLNSVYEECEKNSIPLRVLPGLSHLAQGRINIDALKKVEIEDLLGREPISIVNKSLQAQLHDKVVLVTGGGGSIGSELCRQIAINRPRSLVIVDNSEYNLFKIQLELLDKFPQLDIALSLTDVSREDELKHCFDIYQPNIVFHAAAFKHVPMLEHQIFKAVKNNVLASKLIIDLSDQYLIESFVLVSTDKAVNPTNVMGMSKRLAEIYCQTKNANSKTKFITVRFGNVLGSNGSVLPLFRKQLASGGPLTVTHPDMTRYFMMIPESVTLILQSFLLGKGGEIFVLDMGEPVKIVDLAEKLIQLSGRQPYTEIDIKFTGVRPGEKLFEEIFHNSEQLTSTPNAKILISNARAYNDGVKQLYNNIHEAYHARDLELLKSCMLQLVPEYKGRHAASGSKPAAMHSNQEENFV